jgi:hypothetical protein
MGFLLSRQEFKSGDVGSSPTAASAMAGAIYLQEFSDACAQNKSWETSDEASDRVCKDAGNWINGYINGMHYLRTSA